MTRTVGIFLAIMAALGALIAFVPWKDGFGGTGGGTGGGDHVPKGVPVDTIAQYEGLLAKAVEGSLHDSNAVIVVPFTYQSGVGALLRPDGAGTDKLPYEDGSCRPLPLPDYNNANMPFETYSMKSGLALNATVSPTEKKELANGGVSFNSGNSVELTLEDPQMLFLPQANLLKLLSNPDSDCVKMASAGGPYYIVRGYIRAKRTFVVAVQRGAGLKAGTVIGGFEVSRDAGNGFVEVRDRAPTNFLQLLTMVSIAPATASVPPPPAPGPDATASPAPVASATPVAAPTDVVIAGRLSRISPTILKSKVVLPNVATNPNAPRATLLILRPTRIFVQRDVADGSDTGQRVLAALRAPTRQVVPQIEAIPSSKMPNQAQVRYANADDRAAAEAVAKDLAAILPGIAVRRLQADTPPGQLEVWLPKVP